MKNTKDEQSSNELLIFIWTKRKPLLIITVLAAIISMVISLLLPVLYESTAIVYPTATSTVSFSEQRNAKASSMDFGEEEHAEQMVQILNSSRISGRIINQYNLPEVYGLKPDEPNFRYKLNNAYEEHISFERTRYGSIKISVLDEDPERAASIANKIVSLIDTVKNELIKERTLPAYHINERKMQKLNLEQQELVEQMDSLSKMGVVNAEARANLFAAFNEAKTSEDRAFFKDKIDVNIKYGALYDALADLREYRIDKLTTQEVAYEQAESDALENFNHKFVVETAIPADKKAKPKRSIIVLISTFGALIFGLITLLIQDRVRELKKLA